MSVDGVIHRRFTRHIHAVVRRIRVSVSDSSATRFHEETCHERRNRTDGVEGADELDCINPELLVDPRERFLRLLAEHGGRMKQSELVAAVDCSKATVSRKLTDLEASGAIVRHQIGREKLVFFPDARPDSFEAPINRAADEQAEFDRHQAT